MGTRRLADGGDDGISVGRSNTGEIIASAEVFTRVDRAARDDIPRGEIVVERKPTPEVLERALGEARLEAARAWSEVHRLEAELASTRLLLSEARCALER